MSEQPRLVRVRTATLEIACEVSGPDDGAPVILLHGFPDDPRTWDGAVAQLAGAGYRTIVPYLRGYGPTRFLHDETLRSGQQAALGQDLLELLDALQIKSADLAYTIGAARRLDPFPDSTAETIRPDWRRGTARGFVVWPAMAGSGVTKQPRGWSGFT